MRCTVKIKKGCLIKALKDKEVDLIIHQCNCFSTWGSGIAKQLKQEHFSAYLADRDSGLTPKQKLGKFSSYGSIIYNAYGQYTYGKGLQTDYEQLRNSLTLIEKEIPDNVLIGMPKIGCGLAGGDWVIVSEIINEVFIRNEVIVYEYP